MDWALLISRLNLHLTQYASTGFLQTCSSKRCLKIQADVIQFAMDCLTGKLGVDYPVTTS